MALIQILWRSPFEAGRTPTYYPFLAPRQAYCRFGFPRNLTAFPGARAVSPTIRYKARIRLPVFEPRAPSHAASRAACHRGK